MYSSNKRRKRAQVKEEELELDFELATCDKLDFFKCLRELYVKRSLCDIVFETSNNTIYEAHRVVVAASSGYLGALIRSEMQESEKRHFFIKEDGLLFKMCLDFLYGLPIKIESSQVVPLLGLSNSYSMLSLRDQLADRLERNLTVENCCAIYSAADAYSCLQLKEHALSKIFNNFAHASKTSSFLDLPVQLVILLLSSDAILDCDEAVVFEAAARWLENNTESLRSNSSSSSSSSILKPSPSPCPSPSPSPVFGASTAAHHTASSISSAEVLEVLRAVRYPLMDAGYLSDVIKGHPLMKAPERANLLMEAFEHHALRAAGRICQETSRTRPRKQTCSFSQSTLLNGHQDSVSALVVIGDWLLSGSWDTSIKVWSTDTWQCIRTLSDHTDSIKGLCACNEKVVSCSDDGSIKIWTPGSWTCVRSLEGHEGAVNAVVLCGSRLASAGDDGVINLWNTTSWSCEVTVHHGPAETATTDEEEAVHTVGVMSLEVVGTGSRMRLISGSDDAAIKIWNTSSWTCERVLRAHQDEIWALRCTSEGTLVTGSVDGTIRSWRYHVSNPDSNHGLEDNLEQAADWVCESVVSSSAGPVYAVICLEGRVVSAGAGSRIAVWGSDWTLHRWFDTSEAGVWALAVCKGRLVSGGVDGTLRVWT